MVLLVVGGAGGARAQTARPTLLSVFPPGLQRGTTAEITLTGAGDLADASRALVEGPGLTAEILSGPAPAAGGRTSDTLRVRVTAAAAAPPGPRELRVVTARGVSNVAFLVVGEGSEAVEQEPNDQPPAASALGAAGVVNGRLGAKGDRDLFRFTAAAGESIAFSVDASRLQERAHDAGLRCDPTLTLRSADGREIAANDDYHRLDPMLAYRFERAGDYFIEVQDARGDGHNSWVYRLTVARGPVARGVFPLAASRGGPVSLRPTGFNLEGAAPVRLDLPGALPTGPYEVRIPGPGGPLAPVNLLVSDGPEGVESEGNDAAAQPNRLPFPGGVSGSIGTAFDVDHFAFHAARGEAWVFEIDSARLGYSLRPQVAVLTARGALLATSASAEEDDALLCWVAPAEGDYVVQVTDTGARGGEDYCYHLAARRAAPDFRLTVDDDRAQLGPGGSAVWYVHAERAGGFNGEIALAVEGLPPGVTATAGRIPAGMADACIIFTAPPAAQPDFAFVTITGTAQVPAASGSKTVARPAQPLEEYYSAARGRALFPVNQAAVCVTGPGEVAIATNAAAVTLTPGQMTRIEVTIARRPGCKSPVKLELAPHRAGPVQPTILPPGVTLVEAESKLAIGPGETKGWITLQAAATAPPSGPVPLPVLGMLSLNTLVKARYASAPLQLSVGTK
jgi:hypothetical protein